MKKTYTYIMVIMAAAACSRMDELQPQGGIILTEQLQEVNSVIPSRADASFNGMFTKLGSPGSVTGGTRPDDFGFVMMAFSNDIEAADVVLANSGYNWFSACGALTSRNADYANPYIRYAAPYNTIAAANDILKSYPADSDPSGFPKGFQRLFSCFGKFRWVQNICFTPLSTKLEGYSNPPISIHTH